MQDYAGRVAVVTGASSGIGRRLAVDLAARGATVIGLARREPLLAELRPLLQQTSPRSDVGVCDVADVNILPAVLADIEKTYGQIDVLVNNAGSTSQPRSATVRPTSACSPRSWRPTTSRSWPARSPCFRAC